jgi:hypothetical protein
MGHQGMPKPRYLLILACSQRKRPDPGLLPAIERYDGVNFRIFEKSDVKNTCLKIGILLMF